MPFKSFFKKRKGTSVTQPTPSSHPSPSVPREAAGLGPVSGSYSSGTQSALTTPSASSVATPNERLAPRPSNASIPQPTRESLYVSRRSEWSVTPEQVPARGPASSPVFFENAHDIVLNNPTIIAKTEIFNSRGGASMQLLESRMIRGAEHDSSARYPPPKCHPGTRKTLKEEIFHWAGNPRRSWRMFYILGSAGVGKSAVAQTVADEIDCLGASCFISRPNRRDDPDGVIPTLAYQLAVKHRTYKHIITEKLAEDPTILRKTRRVQFKELLIDPFHIIMTQDISTLQKHFLIIIDGLDECKDEEAQCEFIELIGNHVRSFPEFPLLWLICSRPESHIKYTLSRPDFQITCRREEMSVNDKEGRRDVLLYLRGGFRDIQSKHPDSLDSDWPPETHLLRIATAASGLFAFASTVVRFVGSAEAGDPSSQLQVCMKAFEGSRTSVGQNPYLSLDLLYRHILSSVNSVIRPTTMRILGMSVLYPYYGGPSEPVQALANFLSIRKAAFYYALKPLHSVLRVPSSSDIFPQPISFYHASFGDFLKDPERSGEFCLDEPAVHYDVTLTALRWLMGHEIHTDDLWVSPLRDAQNCLRNTKTQSWSVLWEACSRLKGENAFNVYQELHKFDFNLLGDDIPSAGQFCDFLKWLQLQESNSSTQKLLNSLSVSENCTFEKFTQACVPVKALTNLITGDLAPSTTIHFDLGIAKMRRHIHIYTISE